MPSPVEDRPGLLLRDSLRYSDAVLIVPPQLVQCLACFDGEQTGRDLHELLFRMSGDLRAGELGDQLNAALSQGGFLEDENFLQLREARHREFAEAPVRVPAHAGSGYPDDPEELSQVMRYWMGEPASESTGGPGDADRLIGIAAPHVSPEGGYESYRAAYAQ